MIQRRTAYVHRGDWRIPCFDSILIGERRISLYSIVRIGDGSDVGCYLRCKVVFNRRSDRLGSRDGAVAIRASESLRPLGDPGLTCQT